MKTPAVAKEGIAASGEQDSTAGTTTAATTPTAGTIVPAVTPLAGMVTASPRKLPLASVVAVPSVVGLLQAVGLQFQLTVTSSLAP